MTETLLADTGALYALADRSDRWHEPTSAFVASQHPLLVVPVSVLPEACYLLNTHLDPAAERRFLAACVRGELLVEPLTAADLGRSTRPTPAWFQRGRSPLWTRPLRRRKADKGA